MNNTLLHWGAQTFAARTFAALISAALISATLSPALAFAQKYAFTAEGERVYRYEKGSWSTDPDQTFSELLEMELQQERGSDSSDERCTLIFGLHNGFAVGLKEVAADLQFLDRDNFYLQTRRVTFKNPRAGKIRFAEVQMKLEQGCDGYASFDVVDVPTCRMDDGTKIENCFSSFAIKGNT